MFCKFFVFFVFLPEVTATVPICNNLPSRALLLTYQWLRHSNCLSAGAFVGNTISGLPAACLYNHIPAGAQAVATRLPGRDLTKLSTSGKSQLCHCGAVWPWTSPFLLQEHCNGPKRSSRVRLRSGDGRVIWKTFAFNVYWSQTSRKWGTTNK